MFFTPKRVGPVTAITVLTIAALGLAACTAPSDGKGTVDVNTLGGDVTSAVDEAIANALTLSGSTEAVVGVWQGENGYVRGYGDGVSGSTKFNSAQTGQPVMCAAFLDLVDQGKMTLNRKISTDLPRQPGIADITYAQLCNQTSGIADFKEGFADIFVNNPTRPWPEQEILANGLAHSPLPWPGKNVYLSDTNAVLLDRALRQTTRLDTAEILKTHVFDPAGMSDSSYPKDFEDERLPAGTLTPTTYPAANGAPVCEAGATTLKKFLPDMFRGAGSTYTTVTDLKKFYDKFLSGEFGGSAGKEAIAELRPVNNPERDEAGNPTTEPDAAGTQIGFGFEKVGPLSGRSGAITGTLSAAYSDPKTGLTVVVALNNSSAGANFAQALAFQLAALAGAELPWSAEEQRAKLTELAVCQAAPEEAPAEG